MKPAPAKEAGVKLNPTLARVIRERHAEKQRRIRELNDQYSARAMAMEYRVSKRAIDDVLAYVTWPHA